MSRDPLDALGELARSEERPSDERWEALTRGEMPAEELAELERRAETDPEIARMLELHRPLDREARQRIVGRLTPAKVVPLWQRVVTVAVPLAAAAALVLWLAQPAHVSPLPAYQLSASGESAVRSDPSTAGPIRLTPGSQLRLVIRPATAVEGDVAVRFHAKQADQIEPLAIEAERAEAGALRLNAPAERIFGSRRGTWTLVALVGRPEVLERDAAHILRSEASEGLGWQRFAVEVTLADR